MSAHRKAIRVVTFPFRAMWFLVLVANLLVVTAACVVIAAFLAYGLALTLSYLLLPTEWTRALWQWAADLYEQSHWFKGATITFFVLLFLPILKFWPGSDPKADAAREREANRLNDDLVAARQQAQSQANLRG
ncbi:MULTISPECIES: hypothetical protein [unclassified Rhizobium]|jgi:hypothetical protein|uniref:hypothetical protein n=1 Tax=unclassified Rhizobium TaxID=2613769 RepID=UPI00064614FF|nr:MULTISPECIES: hypothetical protein [unclassified Rhizobium]NKJ08461.1 cytochrome c biogenesis protein ResB [Rhizobium sp. SG741]OCJ08264.1 hypothetical protein A6U86_28665 [Rhizobium sp. AC27/96]RKD50489.1 hypothetical protein BJ928_12177 [Rhizobium sp. WW_1]TIX93285.1 hypothetical protein BSK43_001195 [Rhizobium sp. P44RR-XXIV]